MVKTCKNQGFRFRFSHQNQEIGAGAPGRRAGDPQQQYLPGAAGTVPGHLAIQQSRGGGGGGKGWLPCGCETRKIGSPRKPLGKFMGEVIYPKNIYILRYFKIKQWEENNEWRKW